MKPRKDAASGHEPRSVRRRPTIMHRRPTRRAHVVRSVALWTPLLLLGLAGETAAETVRLRLSFQLPLTGTLGANLVRLKEAVARITENELAIEILHGAEAMPDRTVAKSVMAGD